MGEFEASGVPPGLDPGALGECLDTLDVGIVVFDAALRLVYCNRRYGELLDIPAHLTRLGTRFADILRHNAERGEVDDRDAETVVAELSDRRRAGAPCRYDRVRPNGTVLEVTSRALDGGGFTSTVADVTERRRQERRLAEGEAWFRSVVDGLPGAVAIRDLDFRYLFNNATSRAWYRTTTEELNRSSPEDRFGPAMAALLRELDRRAAEERRLVPHETEAVFPDGERRATLTIRFPIVRPDGSVAAVGGYETDITALRATQAALAESEARFRDLAEVGSDWHWEMDEHLRFVGASRHAPGLGSARVAGRTRRELALDRDDPKWDAHEADLAERRPFRDFQYVVRLADGRLQHVRVSGRPVFGADGAFRGYRGVGRDVTAEVEAREIATRLASALDAVNNIVLLFDREERLIYRNRHYGRFQLDSRDGGRLGETAETIFRRTSRNRFEHRLEPTPEAFVERRLAAFRRPEGPFELQHFHGRWWLVEDHRLADGGTITVVSDITALKEQEAMLVAARHAAEQANRAKSALLAQMSHELRTPLNAIIGFSDLMLQPGLTLPRPKLAAYTRDIRDAGRHLLSMVEDILDYARLEIGRRELRIETVSIRQLVSAVVRLLRPLLKERRLRLAVAIPRSLATIEADARAVRQILINLLGNAIKFTPPGGRVAVRAGHGPGEVVLEVVDDGPGMDPAVRDRAFEPVWSVRPGAAGGRRGGGGLGLPIVRTLAQMHGGSLAIESEPGRGTTVTVRLPTEPAGAAERLTA